MSTKIAFNQIDGAATYVRDFGAVGDGVTDDTATIQAALDTGAKKIVFGEGTYLLSSSLVLQASGQELSAEGEVTLKSSGLSSTDPIIYSENKGAITIKDFTFDCNQETYMAVRATLDTPASDLTGPAIIGNKVVNTATTATSLYGGITVDNKQGASYTYQYKGVEITGNHLDNGDPLQSSHGCIVAYASEVNFSGNNISSAGFHGMEAVGCTGVTITNNLVKDCYKSGLGVGANTKDFLITDNKVTNCDGDGAITVEQNSVQGIVSDNTLIDCTNNGINVSFGSAGAAPFNEVNNIIVSNNLIMSDGSTDGRIGINAYSSTGAAIGDAVLIKDNIVDGFATGIECTWLIFGQVSGNVVRRFGNTSVGRPNKTFISLVGCDKMTVSGNTCTENPTADAIVVDTSTVANSRAVISNNLIQSATAGALVSKLGNGDLIVVGNKTFGAINYVSCDGTQTVILDNNSGPLTGAPLSGGSLSGHLSGVTGTPEGAISASVGSTVTRGDGGASTTLYVKETGTGNTGWVAK